MKAKKAVKPAKKTKKPAKKAAKAAKPILTVDAKTNKSTWVFGDFHPSFTVEERELLSDFIDGGAVSNGVSHVFTPLSTAALNTKEFFDGQTDISSAVYQRMFQELKGKKPKHESIILEDGGTGMVISAEHHTDGNYNAVVADFLSANQYRRRQMLLHLGPDGIAYFNDGLTEVKFSSCTIYDLYVMLSYLFEHAEPGHMAKRTVYHKG